MPNAQITNRPRHHEDGFTLLEILVAVVVVSILTVLLNATVFKQTEKADMAELQGTVNSAIASTVDKMPFKEGFSEKDLDTAVLGKHTVLKFHRVSVVNYCIAVWDTSLTEGVGSASTPLIYDSSEHGGGCAKVGVTGIPFDRAQKL